MHLSSRDHGRPAGDRAIAIACERQCPFCLIAAAGDSRRPGADRARALIVTQRPCPHFCYGVTVTVLFMNGWIRQISANDPGAVNRICVLDGSGEGPTLSRKPEL